MCVGGSRIFCLLWDAFLQAKEITAYVDLRGLSVPPVKLSGSGSKGKVYLQDRNFLSSVPGLIMISSFWMDGLDCGVDAQDGGGMGRGRVIAGE